MAEKVEKQIADFLFATGAASRELSAQGNHPISSSDVERALVDITEVDESSDLLDRSLTSEAMVEVLRTYNFSRLHPLVLQKIEVVEDFIPDGVVRRLTEELVRHRNHVWMIHKNDADPFPSNPHAHNYESGHKLHLGTGGLYVKRQCVGRMKLKYLKDLRGRIRYRPLPALVPQ